MDEPSSTVCAVAGVWSDIPGLLCPEERASFESAVVIALRAVEGAESAEAGRRAAAGLASLFTRRPEVADRFLAELAELAAEDEGGFSDDEAGPVVPGGVPYLRSLILTVLYATDRAAGRGAGTPRNAGSAQTGVSTTGGRPGSAFGGRRGPLVFGAARVGVPDDHRMGVLEKPARWSLRFRARPARDVLVGDVTALSREAFVERARTWAGTGAEREAAGAKDVLVFVHGYHVGFEDALTRTAQIVYDLQFPGLAVLYSWPSRGSVLSYTHDENNARWTVPHFREFLRVVRAAAGTGQVHIVAHSMGCRVVADALADPGHEPGPAPEAPLGQVVFAAPDIDAEVFRDLAPAFVPRARGCTLYASSNDKALALSRRLAGYPRAGQSGSGMLLVDGVDTVDASDLDTGLSGHSYIGDNSSILSDLYALVRHGHPPAERFGLNAVTRAGSVYWRFPARRG
ncbi:alpha/beta hydrolase [Streptomyces sp. 8L]|uniref:alpha/beta hydrolase n=1 Tax=Streptomyces sp. 8L TaxID=2877242 RepID=UPI001CD575C5|nr:alpha/beta hydrolase [Streptomyces sp. 8L]MCA1217009.1 alpha/beta hydrolase [Streptomyces sp. 8L]